MTKVDLLKLLFLIVLQMVFARPSIGNKDIDRIIMHQDKKIKSH